MGDARPGLEILTQNDGFLELLADAMKGGGDRIQGFLYADYHVIRDLHKPWDQQEIWRRTGDYEVTHAAMMRQIEIERLRIAVTKALSMAESPWPGQEKAAAQVQAILSGPASHPPSHKEDSHGEG